MVKFPSKQDIARLSRDRPFLVKAAITLAVPSFLLALVLSLFSLGFIDEKKNDDDKKPETFSAVTAAIRNPAMLLSAHSSWDYRYLEPEPGSDSDDEIDLPKLIGDSKTLSDLEKDLLGWLFQGLRVPDKRTAAIENLKKLPERTRFRNEFLGDLYFVADEKDEALSRYLMEGTAFLEARYSQRSALLELWNLQEFERLENLLEEPGYRNALSRYDRMSILTDARNFPGLLRVVFQESLAQLRFPSLIPPFFTALIWALILLAFCRINKRMIALSFVAFLLGMLSASLTLFTVIIQNRIQGFTEANATTPVSELIYWIAGVGLREELIKLICFIPIAIWILPKRNNLQALILAGMVGLGFACEENFAYFARSGVTDVIWARFLTANALHFSLTGITGFYFYRMLVRKGWGMEDFVLYFLIVVASHGFYDALLSMPSLSSYSTLSTIVLALIAYMYFDLLRDNIDIDGLHRRVSPLGVFVLGSAVLLYSILIFSSGINSFGGALSSFSLSLGAMIPLSFAFISRFRDI